VFDAVETQVVVIGSGAGGAAIAGELCRHSIPTIVVEAGPQCTRPLGSHVRNRDPSEGGLSQYNDALNGALTFPSGGAGSGSAFRDFKVIHAVGGMLSYWTCNCPTPHVAERAPWITDAEWDSILDRARTLLGVGYDLGNGSVRQQRLIERVSMVVGREEAGRDVQPMPVAARRQGEQIRFASIENLLRVENVSNGPILHQDLICRQILHRSGRATGIIARPGVSGDDIAINAEVVVIAAGVAGTPKLIGGSRIDAGPALGAYLFDHPAIGSRVVLHRDILADVAADDPVFTVWIPYALGMPWHNQICRFPTNPTAIEYAAGPNETADIFTFCSMDVLEANRFNFDFDRLDPFGLPETVGAYALGAPDRGEVVHKGIAHPGEHKAIVDDELWSAVQAKLSSNLTRRRQARIESGAILGGLIFDDGGNRMSPTYTMRRGNRYRYYISPPHLQRKRKGSRPRISADDVERLIVEHLCRHQARNDLTADLTSGIWSAETRELILTVVDRVVIHHDQIEVRLKAKEAAPTPASARGDDKSESPNTISLPLPPARPRERKEIIVPSNFGTQARRVDQELILALARARSWMRALRQAEFVDTGEIAQRFRLSDAHVRRLLRFGYLAPILWRPSSKAASLAS